MFIILNPWNDEVHRHVSYYFVQRFIKHKRCSFSKNVLVIMLHGIRNNDVGIFGKDQLHAYTAYIHRSVHLIFLCSFREHTNGRKWCTTKVRVVHRVDELEE